MKKSAGSAKINNTSSVLGRPKLNLARRQKLTTGKTQKRKDFIQRKDATVRVEDLGLEIPQGKKKRARNSGKIRFGKRNRKSQVKVNLIENPFSEASPKNEKWPVKVRKLINVKGKLFFNVINMKALIFYDVPTVQKILKFP